MRRLWMCLLGVLAACAQPTAVAGDADFRVVREGQDLILSTGTGEPYYYFAVDAELLPFINWAVCTQPAQCPSVRRGMPARIALQDLAHEGRELAKVTVFYWHLVPHGDGLAPDSIRNVGITF